MKILVVNAGSSTYKLSLYDLHDESQAEPLWKGELDWGEGAVCKLSAKALSAGEVHSSFAVSQIDAALKELVGTLWNGPAKVIEGPQAVEKIGHRVVHGGSLFISPVLIDAKVKEQIKTLIPLAPLHNPGNLEGIELMQSLFPTIPQIAVFDTSFHATISEVIKTYPIPYVWKEKGIQRYGFHGISHQYCAERAPELLNEKVNRFKMINCHLGNGASLCAIESGKSVDTTMGLTPLEGLMMGTRCGSIDPGILLYLLREEHFTPNSLDEMLNFESGLKGICGASDMREIAARRDDQAKLAIEMFVYRLKYFICAMASSLGGVDVLSFTGGIGEHSASIREAACEGLRFLGAEVDKEKNAACVGVEDQLISTKGSKVKILVIHTREEWMIARICTTLIKKLAG